MRDISSFIQALNPDTPGGPNLEYDSEFLALERLATPREERGVGDAVRLAQEPEWKEVAGLAERLAVRTRDLRIVLHMTHAWLALDGLPAFVKGLELIRTLLEVQWDGVHPSMEDDDPTERINALAVLCADPGILGSLRRVRVISLERVGVVSLRELRIVTDAPQPGEDDATHTLSEQVAIILGQAGESHLRTIDAMAASGIAHLEAMGRVFALHTPGRGPDIEPLVRELGMLRRSLRAYLPEACAVEENPTNSTKDNPDAALTVTQASPRDTLGPDEIRRRLDEICAWYAANEPASPVPALLRRARNLIGMDFVSLLQAVAPGGLGEFNVLAGED